MKAAESRTLATELDWVRSSYSGAEGGQCVEVAAVPGAVLVRDSKCPAGTRLAVRAEAWTEFVRLAVGR
ncbi:DUF397 domain-containing protein [Streptomyces heliomycini]|uniref:DUF397 domain-containing protein n=1 Tax=Streptomyces heliomycini TaxID=284032 RepID=A0ABV5LAL7_9ACTN